MPMPGRILLLAAALAPAQEALPFPEDRPSPWLPAWELSLRGDRISGPVSGLPIQREDLALRLRWTAQRGPWRAVAGTRSALGSDGDRLNGVRWDQQPSNGTRLDLARLELTGVTPRTFGALNLGFQESGLLAGPGLWDRDLRFLGAGASAGGRTDGPLQEASLRAAAGRVRTLLGGDLDLAAGQAVLKLDTGPWSWTAYGGLWQISWKAGPERLQALPGHAGDPRQRLRLAAWGAETRWNHPVPLEARWSAARNPATGERSEAFQVLAGSREWTWRPQLGLTWQRLSATGTLYPVNGDDWWFYRSAQGTRLDLALPLPGRWLLGLACLRQREDGETYVVERRTVQVMKRF